jgi:hypothetical protein
MRPERAAIAARALERVERARRRAAEAVRPFDGLHFKVEPGWGTVEHRVVHKRLGTIRGHFPRLACANACAARLDAEHPTPVPVRRRALHALVYVALFTISTGTILRRLLP